METDGKNNLFWIFKMIQTIKSDKWCCLCQNRVQIWIPLGQKHIKRAITHDPTTFGYEVMTKSNIGWRPYWILRLWRRQWAPALAPSKNEFSVFWSTSVPNFMLVDKCAQKIPKLLHYLGTESFGLGNMKITKKCTFCVLMAYHELCVCHVHTLRTVGRTERTVLCIAIEWNIVYFRDIK